MKPFLFFFFFLLLVGSVSALRVGVYPARLALGEDYLVLINPQDAPLELTLEATSGIEVDSKIILEAKEKRRIKVRSLQEGSIEVFGAEQLSAGLVVLVEDDSLEEVISSGLKGIWFLVFVNLGLLILGVFAWKKNIFSF